MPHKKLKWQLFASGVAAVFLIACLVIFALNGYKAVVVVSGIALAAYIAAVNVWFHRYVSKPIEALTDSAKRIAGGSYGTQTEKLADNEIGDLTDMINDMSIKVGQADAATTEFVSQISHELRTPLTAITGWSETLQFDPAIQGESLRGVAIISKEAERLTGMVSDLLEFTRIQDGRFNLRIELVDIAAELEDSLFTYGNLLSQAGIELDYSSPDNEIALIPGDPERLREVFLNLLDNAAKHGGDGGRIEVTLSDDMAWITIDIRDYGKGISVDELPHVKEKFYKGSSKNRGSGIGLAVCDEIVLRHGGSLIIDNAEGGGCVARVKLPKNSGRG